LPAPARARRGGGEGGHGLSRKGPDREQWSDGERGKDKNGKWPSPRMVGELENASESWLVGVLLSGFYLCRSEQVDLPVEGGFDEGEVGGGEEFADAGEVAAGLAFVAEAGDYAADFGVG